MLSNKKNLGLTNHAFEERESQCNLNCLLKISVISQNVFKKDWPMSFLYPLRFKSSKNHL